MSAAMAEIAFDNSYARLPERFYTRQDPVPVPRPQAIAVNTALAADLGIDPACLTPEVLTGNVVPTGAAPLAQVYSGHQFGNWAGQLGDGRAILLGEVVGRHGRRDIVLKGAGRTPYSRGGDGRAWLGPVLREYVLSEAMAALGVPTTRALGAALTGAEVMRERPLPGAVLMRVAASHIRVGTFQHFAAAGDTEALKILLDHTLARHYPDAQGALGLLGAAVQAQAELVAQWMALGFIHGVMNTDNMALSGETIDYGPCAFMDDFNPGQVFSSIDRGGRYAWNRQPEMAAWNLSQLAGALLDLIDPDEDTAIAAAQEVLARFTPAFEAAWHARLKAKLGLRRDEPGDGALIAGLLSRMASSRADWTLCFRALATGDAAAHVTDPGAWESWAPDWQARLSREPDAPAGPRARMRAANPAVIPRNHQIEAMIEAALAGDFAPFHRLNRVLARPHDDHPEAADLIAAPAPHERVRQTFCGT